MAELLIVAITTIFGTVIPLAVLQRRGLRRIHNHLDRIERRMKMLERSKTEEGRHLKKVQLALDESAKTLNTMAEDVVVLGDGQQQLSIQQSLSDLGFGYPLFFSGWSIDSFLARGILKLLERTRPRVILEVGGGASTVFIAQALKRLGLREETRHIAIDHLEEFLDQTREQLELQGLGDKTELWLCPLSQSETDGPEWYEGVASRLGTTKLDLVLIDGPPGKLHPHSRRPALHVLRPFLSERAILLLDDASRKHERQTIQTWQQAYPEFTVQIFEQGHGYAKLELRQTNEELSPPARGAMG